MALLESNNDPMGADIKQEDNEQQNPQIVVHSQSYSSQSPLGMTLAPTDMPLELVNAYPQKKRLANPEINSEVQNLQSQGFSGISPDQNLNQSVDKHLGQDLNQSMAENLGQNMSMSMSHTSLGSFHELKESPTSTPSTTATGATNTTANFHSNFVNQEYKMLGDLISKPSLPSSLDFSAPAPAMVSPGFLSELELDTNHTRPFISLDNDRSGEPHNELHEQNKPQYMSPLVSHHIYQTVQDIYSNPVVNFDYPLSYHSLTYFLRTRFSVSDKNSESERSIKRKNFLIILKLIASYRPTFISLHNSLLQPYDIHFLEMSFQRCLLDYENLSRLNASPTIIWRRTGEIVSISNDLVNLLGLSISDILSKRTFIMELMYDDNSIVEYFRLFKSVAVGNLHLTIVTKCKLIKRLAGAKIAKTNTSLGDLDYIEFCSVWTVKRDLFDLPMMIVGQFLPVLPTNGGIRTY